jgi:hypothetical protein
VDQLESRELLAAGPFGLNVEIGDYASLVNWLQFPGSWSTAPGQTNPIALNASGDPTSDAALTFDYRVNQSWNGPDPNAVPPDLSGTYHLSFNGQATIQSNSTYGATPFSVQNQIYDAATNTTHVDLTIPAGNTNEFFSIVFSKTQATPFSGLNTGFSNARLIRPGYAADTTQIYTNDFLAALKPYGVLRYLDVDNANNQPFFNGTTLVTVDAPQVDQTGMPWEYLIALANQTNTDMWINIPEGATDAYVTALAGIFKNGGTVGGVNYPGLNPNLKIYLEYSNEVWGGIPSNLYYQQAAVENGASNQPLSTFPGNAHVYDNPDGTTATDPNVAVARRYLERTAEIGQIFQSVLGADPTHQRLRPVLGWQENNSGFYPPTLDWFEHFFGPAASAFYGMGNATYWNPTDYSSVNSILSTLQQQETAYAIPNTIDYTTLATYYGLKNVSYEGGPSIGADGNTAAGQNALAASRDPRIEQIIEQHYINYYADGGNTAAYYSGPFGQWSPQNEWPAAELAQASNPSASPKYRGILDVANAAPVAVTAGVQVAAGTGTSFDATTDSLGNSFAAPRVGQKAYWLLNVAAAGTYDLQMTTSAVGGAAPGQVAVYLDDQLVGSPRVSASSTIDLGNLSLSAGLNTLMISVIHGSFELGPASASYYQWHPTTFALAPVPVSGTTDTTTQGNWRLSYGGDGYAIAQDTSAANPVLPSYAQLSISGVSNYTWSTSASDVRNLQNAAINGRIAGTWYTTSTASFNLNLTGGLVHRIAIYAVDWDNYNGGRSERFDVIDTTGTVLDSETLSNFQNGAYLVWNLGGNVTIRVTNLNPRSNAVVSGIFFGGASFVAASFVGTDAAAQGNWRSSYGGDGYAIAQDTSTNNNLVLPSYAQLSISGASNYTWSTSPSDVRNLQNAANNGRIAGTWYTATTASFNLNLTGGQVHRIAIYAVDWDNYNGGRSERFDVINTTGTVLDSETLSNFQNGVYLVWNLGGNVTIRVTNLNPRSNAVVSGIFFGGNASFVGTDATTQGNWRSSYGGDGYAIAQDTSTNNNLVLPSYAQLSLSGASNWTWSTSPSDVRNLQNAANNGRIAGTWASSSTEDFNLNLSDGRVHRIAIYAVDWDNYNGGRSERFDIIDSSTGAVLDSETLSNFQNGVYLVWNLSGNVTIRVTNLNSKSNAVVSGIFFG